MPSASELARQDAEAERPNKFDITIDFGPHQAKLKFDKAALRSAKSISAEIGKEIELHINAMLEAEERNAQS